MGHCGLKFGKNRVTVEALWPHQRRAVYSGGGGIIGSERRLRILGV